MKLEQISTKSTNIITWPCSDWLYYLTFYLFCYNIGIVYSTTRIHSTYCFGVLPRVSSWYNDFTITTIILTNKMVCKLRYFYDQLIGSRWALSIISCTNEGNYHHFVFRIYDRTISASIYVSGYLPTTETLFYSLTQLQGKIGFFLSELNTFN